MPYIITEPCIGEKNASCVEVCPVNCIHEGTDQYFIDPVVCIDCGACVPVCPVDAIFADYDVTEKQLEYISKNYEYFGLAQPVVD